MANPLSYHSDLAVLGLKQQSLSFGGSSSSRRHSSMMPTTNTSSRDVVCKGDAPSRASARQSPSELCLVPSSLDWSVKAFSTISGDINNRFLPAVYIITGKEAKSGLLAVVFKISVAPLRGFVPVVLLDSVIDSRKNFVCATATGNICKFNSATINLTISFISLNLLAPCCYCHYRQPRHFNC